MRVVALSTLRGFWTDGDAHAELPMRAWYAEACKATWKNFSDVKRTFNQTDILNGRYIFDIGGNKWRVIADINFDFGGVLIKWVGDHKAYEKLTERQIADL